MKHSKLFPFKPREGLTKTKMRNVSIISNGNNDNSIVILENAQVRIKFFSAKGDFNFVGALMATQKKSKRISFGGGVEVRETAFRNMVKHLQQLRAVAFSFVERCLKSTSKFNQNEIFCSHSNSCCLLGRQQSVPLNSNRKQEGEVT